MKRFLKIFVLSANEQRVVLIIVLILITIAVVAYKRRIDQTPVESTAAIQPKPTSTALRTVGGQ